MQHNTPSRFGYIGGMTNRIYEYGRCNRCKRVTSSETGAGVHEGKVSEKRVLWHARIGKKSKLISWLSPWEGQGGGEGAVKTGHEI